MGYPKGHRAGPELASRYGLPISSQGHPRGHKVLCSTKITPFLSLH
jgi:hypothetical protein